MQTWILDLAERALRRDVRVEIAQHWSGVLGAEVDVVDVGRPRILRDSVQAREASIWRALNEACEVWVEWNDGPQESTGEAILDASEIRHEIHPELPPLRIRARLARRRVRTKSWVNVLASEFLGERERTCTETLTALLPSLPGHHAPQTSDWSGTVITCERELDLQVSTAAEMLGACTWTLLSDTGEVTNTSRSLTPGNMRWLVEEGLPLADAALVG